MKEFEFLLKEGDLRYQPEGMNTFVGAKKLLLKAPNMRQEKAADRLSQALMRMIKSTAAEVSRGTQSNKTKSSENVVGSDIKALLFMSNIDIAEIKDAFKTLIFEGACLIDGVLPMRDHHYNDLDYNKANDLLGEYIANFLLPSLISEKK